MNLFKVLIICIISIHFISCDFKSNISLEEVIKIELINDFEREGVFKKANYQQTGDFKPVYLGKLKDTILLDYLDDFPNYRKWSWVYQNLHTTSVGKINLIIDTTKLIYSNASNSYNYEKKKWKPMICNAHPIFLQNILSDSLNIGFGDYVPLVMEAQQFDGQWSVIETPFIYMCGTGLTTIVLPPQEIAIIPVPIYGGNYKTRCRVRLNDVISNEFSASIDPSQFEDFYELYGYE